MSQSRGPYKQYFRNKSQICQQTRSRARKVLIEKLVRNQRLNTPSNVNENQSEAEQILVVPPSQHQTENDLSTRSEDEIEQEDDNHPATSSESESVSDGDLFSDDDDDSENEPSSFETTFLTHSSQLLYPGAQISESESTLLLLSFIIRHKLSSVCINDLLKLMSFHLPYHTNFPTSAKRLKKRFGLNYAELQINYYCSSCQKDFGSKSHTSCPNCDYTQVKNNSMTCYINFDIESALKNILKISEVAGSVKNTLEKRKSSTVYYEDIYSGSYYKALNLQVNDLTFTANVDGVPLFVSSKTSLVPLILSLNEISYPLRRRYPIIAGLWCGPGKPDYEKKISPFIDQINKMGEAGVSWKFASESILSRVYCATFVCDSVARCAVMGMHQFNGRYGCPQCLCKGETLFGLGKSKQWIYRPITKEDIVLRTKDSYRRHLEEFHHLLTANGGINFWPTEKEPSHFGITKASTLLLLKKLSIPEGFVFDTLHTCFLGIAKKFLMTWFSTSNSDEPYYLGSRIKEIDAKFLRCLVPFDSDRATRSIEERKFWKGHEFRTWMAVLPIILRGMFSSELYLQHFTLFVNSVLQLCSQTLNDQKIDEIEKNLFKFVEETEALYGLKYCSSNVHLLLHACNCCRMWGPLFSYSTFQFEHYNGIILECFNGTQVVPFQISKRLLDISWARIIGESSFQNIYAYKLYSAMLNNKREARSAITIGNSTMLGKGKGGKVVSNFESDEALRQFCGQNCTFFQKAIVNKKIYDIFDRRTQKRCNCIVRIKDEFFCIRSFMVVDKNNNNLTSSEKLAIVSLSKLETRSISGYVFGFQVEKVCSKLRLVSANEIENYKVICILGENNQPAYLVQMANVVELE